MKRCFTKHVHYEIGIKDGKKTLHPVEWVEVKGYRRMKGSVPAYVPQNRVNEWGIALEPLKMEM